MNELAKQIIIYSAAEQLAKDADFKGNSIEPYLERSAEYYNGRTHAFTDTERNTMRVQELLLLDDETTVLDENPHLRAEFANSDLHQLDAATDSRNLDYYLKYGVEYQFDDKAIVNLRPQIDVSKPISVQLMRERVLGMPGLNAVRMNVAYHDIMDHLWGMYIQREAGLDLRYADFMVEVGNPFVGFLFSKQAELMSGIGYNARRFITDPDHYGSLAASKDAISDHLKEAASNDERVAVAVAKINDSETLARASGFVINGALGSLLLQRSRAGAVKKVVNNKNGVEITKTPVGLMDPRYLSLIIEGVETLLASTDAYQQMQLDLNLTVESLLRDCFEHNLRIGHLALGSVRDISNIPEPVRLELSQNSGVSTSYYS